MGYTFGAPPGSAAERDLSWLDRSAAVGLSADGRLVLLAEIGAGGGTSRAAYIRNTDGSPAIRLADGEAAALSADGKWALVKQGAAPERLVLVPTGAGEARALASGAITDYYNVKWLPDDRRIVFGGIEPGHDRRTYVQEVPDGQPTAIDWPGSAQGTTFLNDSRTYVGRGPGRRFPAFLVSRNGEAYVYNYLRILSTLYAVDGLR